MASQPYLGAIFLFAGNFAPRGYLLCQGQILSISQNSALFSILGTTYGGNGTQTFALPDLRGRAPIGEGTGPGLSPVALGQAAGTQSVSILTTNLPSHSHSLNAQTGNASATAPTSNLLAVVNDGGVPTPNLYSAYAGGSPNTTMSPSSVGLTGSNIPISIQNPYLGINYIIAVNGIFPSRN